MSVVFNLKELNNDISNKIAKILTFTPKNNLQKFQKFNSYTPSEEKIRMYYTTEGVTHLPYYFSCMFFKKKFHLDKTYPNIYEDPNGKFTGKLLDRQKEPFKEAIKYLKQHNTVTIALYPGFGKTFMGVMLSWYLNKLTCVLVHRDNVGKQWVKSFKQYFSEFNDEDVWFVDNKIKENAKILVCMDGRTDKIPQEMKDKIGVLIIDEAHCFCAPSKVKPLLSFSPKYIIAETATPKKDNGMEKVIQSICGTHYIQKISSKPYHFFIIQTNLEYEMENVKNIFQELVTKQTTSKERNQIILNILKENQQYKTIVAGNRKEHCKLLHSSLEEMGLESSELYGTIKNYKTRNILLGTGSKMGVGFDEANFCDDYDGRPSDLLIMLYTFASWAPFEQVRGRGMRAEKPNVVIFNDRHPITKKHMTQIRKWVRETNGIIIELKLDKMESFNLDNYKN
jgi:late competence protein required for DNA uptake (superfamily II DNA/RNA helicase)